MIDGGSVQQAHAQQDVRQGARQAVDGDLRSQETRFAARQRPAFEQRGRGQVRQRAFALPAVRRESRLERQAADESGVGVRQDRLLPEHREAPGGHFRHLEVGGPHFVGVDGRGQQEHCQQHRRRPPSAARAPRFPGPAPTVPARVSMRAGRRGRRGRPHHVPTGGPREVPSRPSAHRTVPRSACNAARFCSRRCASSRSRTTRSRTSSSAGGDGDLRSSTRTRWTPCAEAIGPCQSPASMPSSAAAKPMPNRFAMSRSVRSAYSRRSHERVAGPSPATLFAGAYLAQQRRRVPPRVRPRVGAQIDVSEGRPVRVVVPLGVRREIRFHLVGGGGRQLGIVLQHERHLLREPAAHDRVAAVQRQPQRLAIEDLFPDRLIDQALQLPVARRPAPLRVPPGAERVHLFGGYHDNPLLRVPAGQPVLEREHTDPQEEKDQEWGSTSDLWHRRAPSDPSGFPLTRSRGKATLAAWRRAEKVDPQGPVQRSPGYYGAPMRQ